MSPNNVLLMAANAALADPNFRESVRQMHAGGYPLVQMVEALGLDDEMSDRIRQILDELPPDFAGSVKSLTEYEFMDPEAQRQWRQRLRARGRTTAIRRR